MNAEIISVGTELLLGQVVNTDAAIVAQALSGLGINLLYSAVVGDNADRLRHAVDTAISRSDLLIMTGGLGPTTDDLTKETTAAAAGKKLVLHEESLRRIENYFNEKHVSEIQAKQARCCKTITALPPAALSRRKTAARLSCCPGPPPSSRPCCIITPCPTWQKAKKP